MAYRGYKPTTNGPSRSADQEYVILKFNPSVKETLRFSKLQQKHIGVSSPLSMDPRIS
ncbi:Hypothetical protein FKW44_005307 [Caligus rogercresseyi]|uniref:Uncharacterized protein n=1 Tax=Caligus rogercresseyi TaxID=217165 RepID=A0A7T8KBT0_CALRO|nr:Hypothetical protein FKW44_005307 [Caligus rogercresseyi]